MNMANDDDVSLTVEDQLDIEELRGDDDEEEEDEDDDMVDEEGEDEADIDADFDFLDDSGLYGDEEDGESADEEGEDDVHPPDLLDDHEDGEESIDEHDEDDASSEVRALLESHEFNNVPQMMALPGSNSSDSAASRPRYERMRRDRAGDADSGLGDRIPLIHRPRRHSFEQVDEHFGFRPGGDSGDDEENDEFMGDSYDEESDQDLGFDEDDDEDEGAGAERAHGAPFGDLSQMYGDVALDRDERGPGWGAPGDRFLRAGPGQHHRDRSRSDYSDDPGWSSASSQSMGSEDRSTHSVEPQSPEQDATHLWLQHDAPFTNTLMGRSHDPLINSHLRNHDGPPLLLWNPMPYRRHREEDFSGTFDVSRQLRAVREAVCAGTWPPEAPADGQEPDLAAKLSYQI